MARRPSRADGAGPAGRARRQPVASSVRDVAPNAAKPHRLRRHAPAHRVKQGRTDRQQYDNVHRAILTGLLSNLALRGDGYEYTVAGGGKAHLWPGSGVFQAEAQVDRGGRGGRDDAALPADLRADRSPLDRADRRAPRQADVPRRPLGARPRLGDGLGAGHALRADDRRRAADPLRADRPGHVAAPA